ncbi:MULTISPECIES: NAD-dependent epimerase/dehydratase family protein [Pseudothermotoga]|jgi:UDP-glucose 4-epimerase|uniref:NAD-dependent epimerase/dehydratase n=1 Tax=Pseudothermotoga lettingae (strain ATCC BAA-301 / DSM 14385 / NBRC 107922 / TMO) TaxID=416591 RepID=A8F663_PSELT|nr:MULTISPECIES: NAD-dependent epimerase/dehydratase family protein [Pseudothermotoga]ABV33647.1 NAD-dependent epimerase/dehydratase [Pseudothermotoga lettingae TMO]KUK21252.1 MAG: NAD-dependent epimerase/dehydratase [Pseudothermotoga lettingae]MDI3495196.1 UDP-glucose 4-epimerase [Pseudothermotoga sp.]MDK2883702.1 UDP-glucose 4-epimerase [Pseudothermotoga sp.]GLI49436.1 UDP-glucose 4-epimerase [Pseudothermotoga lettingae TMO]
MASVLVTGGAGFIGSHLVDALIEKGHRVVVVDNLVSGKIENLNKNALFYQQSIEDDEMMERVFMLHRFDFVFHLAAQASVSVSVKEPIKDAKTNILGSLVLLEKSVKHGVKKFIFSSTGGAIYGDNVPLPTNEAIGPNPASPYGIAKRSVEMYLEFYKNEKSLNYIALRYGNVYGPRQDPNGEAGVIAIFSSRMLKGEDVHIFGDGEYVRDYVYVKDVVTANLLAMEKDFTGIYNIGTGVGTSVNALFKMLSTITGYSKQPIYSSPRKGDLRKSILDSKKAELELGWHPVTELSDGLKMTVEFFR